jgi:hypothetical protein
MDLIDEMEAEASAAIAQYDGTNLTELGMLALGIEQSISELEATLKSKKKELEGVMKYAIPQALNAAGIPEFGFEHEGGKARIKNEIKVVGTLKNAADEDDAVGYLENAGLRGAIKSSVTMDFTEEERELAEQLMPALQELTGKHPFLARNIHPSTLAAFVRQKISEDPTFDFERVGFTAFPMAKFTVRK